MLEIAFSLHGRLNRLQYFLGALALGVAYALGLGGLAVGGVVAVAGHNWGVVGLLLLAVLPLALAVLWCSLSLHVRRIRDIGWDPTIVIGSWLIAMVADKLVLAPLLPAKFVAHGFWHGTPLGIGIDVALAAAILFWPSHDADDEDAEAAFLEALPARWDQTMRALEADFTAAVSPRPAQPARLARPDAPVFGRRGR